MAHGTSEAEEFVQDHSHNIDWVSADDRQERLSSGDVRARRPAAVGPVICHPPEGVRYAKPGMANGSRHRAKTREPFERSVMLTPKNGINLADVF